MDIADVKRNMNQVVLLTDTRLHVENVKYLFVGCMLRKNEDGFYYQAELKDLKNVSSLVVAGLKNIEEII